MTPTTLALVERLANDASSGNGAMLIGIDEAARFFALAMEHAAGICDASAFYEDDPQGYARQCAAAIREAGK